MTAQLSMFGAPAAPDTRRRRSRPNRPSIGARFVAFHAANPHVLDEMLRLARMHLATGKRRLGVKALWEELRASLIRIADGGGPDAGGIEYKLDNSLTALYARKLIEVEPALAEVIEIRRRKESK